MNSLKQSPFLPSIFVQCEPRPEVLSGELPDALFAADLWEVIEERAHEDYRDPLRFFANSYPTEHLALLLNNVGERLTGVGGATPIFRLETGFGGGKTHSLIALFHLAGEGSNLARVLQNYGVERLPPPGATRVAAFVGDQSDPLSGLVHENGAIRTYTPWGEIAYRIGGPAGYEQMRANDEQGVAPSRQALERVFGDAPVLVMLDELVLFLARGLALPSDHPRRHVVQQMPTFLQALFGIAANRPRTAVVFTLPSEQDANRRVVVEFRELIPQILEAVEEMAQMGGRQVGNLTPTQSHERAAVLGRRLFQSVDSHRATEVAEAYRHYYQEQRAAGVEIDSRAFDREYVHQLERSYPFHPELIRLFSERLAEIPEFQATRGALRLIARTLRAVWRNRERYPDTLLLHPFHVDLARGELQDELLGRLNRGAFRPALEADVVKSEGGSHAALVEEGWPVCAATEAATTVFLHSLPDGSRGLTVPEVALAVGRPGYDLAYVKRALEETVQRGWHLYQDGARYLFRVRASVNKRFQERVAQVQPGEVREQLDDWIQEIFSSFQAFHVIPFPQEPSAVPDSPERLRLVLVHYDKEAGYIGGGGQLSFTREIFEKKGTEGQPRIYRNSLVFLLAEGTRVERMKQTVRELIAWERVQQDLTDEQRRIANALQESYNRLKEMARRGEAGVPPDFAALENDLSTVIQHVGAQQLAVRSRLLDAYRVLAFPPVRSREVFDLFDLEAARPPLECYRVDFGESPATLGRAPRGGQARQRIEEQPLLDTLLQNNKLVQARDGNSVALAPEIIKRPPIWQDGERKVATAEVWDRLRRNPELPMVLQAVDLLPTFRTGLTATPESLWYYYDQTEKRVYTRETALELSPTIRPDHFLYDVRDAVQDRVIPVTVVQPAQIATQLWPRENGQRLPSFAVGRLLETARESIHFPVLPGRDVLWRALQEGARENRWVLYLRGSSTAIGAQEMQEWPGTPSFQGDIELWDYQAALDARLYPRRRVGETPGEPITPAALFERCWPRGVEELGSEDLERYARGIWPRLSRPHLESLLRDGVREGLWGAWKKELPETFYLAGDAPAPAVAVCSDWSLVLPDSRLARDLDTLRPGRAPQPVSAGGTPREALTAVWDQLSVLRDIEIAQLVLTVDSRTAFDNTLAATWADRPPAAGTEVGLAVEGDRLVGGQRETLTLNFTGRFEELRALLGPVWPFASTGQLDFGLTLTLRFDPPVSPDDATLQTYRTALMNANQGLLEVTVVPVRRARGRR